MYSKKNDNKITLKKEHFLKICHDFRTGGKREIKEISFQY